MFCPRKHFEQLWAAFGWHLQAHRLTLPHMGWAPMWHSCNNLCSGDPTWSRCRAEALRKPAKGGFSNLFRYLTEFQSHEPEFDYLKSLEIEEKINQVRWCHSCNSQLLLSTNDKTIKLWRVQPPSLNPSPSDARLVC